MIQLILIDHKSKFKLIYLNSLMQIKVYIVLIPQLL